MTFDYTDCETLSPSPSLSQLTFTDMSKYSYQLSSSNTKLRPSPPQYAFVTNSSNPDVSQQRQCIINFEIVADLQPSVLVYYKLTNFFQNHRRYVKSLNSQQLKGSAVSAKDLNNCKPLATNSNGSIIYPCGLIANSLFNGTCPLHSLVASYRRLH
jgi:LEM3 (ligand-effect modulator 3) family / CDC50 family